MKNKVIAFIIVLLFVLAALFVTYMIIKPSLESRELLVQNLIMAYILSVFFAGIFCGEHFILLKSEVSLKKYWWIIPIYLIIIALGPISLITLVIHRQITK